MTLSALTVVLVMTSLSWLLVCDPVCPGCRPGDDISLLAAMSLAFNVRVLAAELIQHQSDIKMLLCAETNKQTNKNIINKTKQKLAAYVLKQDPNSQTVKNGASFNGTVQNVWKSLGKAPFLKQQKTVKRG